MTAAAHTQRDATARGRILVVDDEPGPRESLRMILSPRHEVLTAANAVDALEILRTTLVDLVTVDLRMPGMRGDELVRVVREELPHVEIIVITGCGTLESAVEGLRRGVCDYLAKPFDVVQVLASVERALVRRSGRRNLVSFLDGLGAALGHDRDAAELLRDLSGRDRAREQLAGLLAEPAPDRAASLPAEGARTLEFLEVLAEAIDERDARMRGHARRVAFSVGLMADRLCLSGEAREWARLAAFLHDIGKVCLPGEMLSTREALAEEERARVEEHAAVGQRLLRPLRLPKAVLGAVRHHHERWDGGGYPDGLAGEDIPLIARLVAVADAFDAMTCASRPHGGLSSQRALEELRKHAGSQFDPAAVKEMAAIVETGVCDLVSTARESLDG